MFDHDVRDRGSAEDDWRANRPVQPARETELDIWHDEDDELAANDAAEVSLWESVILRRLIKKT